MNEKSISVWPLAVDRQNAAPAQVPHTRRISRGKIFWHLLSSLLFGSLAACAQNPGTPRQPIDSTNAPPVATTPAPLVRWFPISVKFSPDGVWAVVNLCSNLNPLYCKLLRWQPDAEPLPQEGGGQTTGGWKLIEGQQSDKSYIWPDVSGSGAKLAYVVADCTAKREAKPGADGKPLASHLLPPDAMDCAFYNGRPAISASVTDLRVGQQLAPVFSAAKPAWHPNEQAVLYWRTRATTTLASGRVLGARDVYEYDFAERRETPKFDRVTRVVWGVETTGPFYDAGGKRFTICGLASAVPMSMEQATKNYCMSVDASQPADIEVIPTRSPTVFFSAILADSHAGSWLMLGSHIEAVNKVTFASERRILNIDSTGKLTNHSPGFATGRADGTVFVVSGTLGRFSDPIRATGHWTHRISHVPATPVMFAIPPGANDDHAVVPIYWPNADSLR